MYVIHYTYTILEARIHGHYVNVLIFIGIQRLVENMTQFVDLILPNFQVGEH